VTTFMKGASKFYSREIKHNEPKVAEEYCWMIKKHRWKCGHAAADRVLVCFILDFYWTSLFIHESFTTFAVNSGI